MLALFLSVQEPRRRKISQIANTKFTQRSSIKLPCTMAEQEDRATLVQLPASPKIDNVFDDDEPVYVDDDEEEEDVVPPPPVLLEEEPSEEEIAAPVEELEESNTNDNEALLQRQETLDDENINQNDMMMPSAVTADRKQDLLREARADRVAWIQSVPLPYATESSILDITHIVKELPSATKILSHLYGAGSEQILEAKLETLLKDDDADAAVRTGYEILEDEKMDQSKDKDLQIILDDYQEFCNQLERPESAVVVNGIRNSLQRLGTDPATALRNHVVSTLEQLKRQQQQDAWTQRSLESFLYGQAQMKIMATLAKEQIEDEQFVCKLETLSFVSAKHLDLTCFVDDSTKYHLATAASALLLMQSFHSPYEKLQRILKSYHCVNAALKTANNGKLPSADDVLPSLILTVLQAKPEQMVSNLRMLEVYSPAEFLRGEAGYAYTNLYGAVQFLRDLDVSDNDDTTPMTSLTITPQEFRAGLEASRATIEAQLEASNKSKTSVLLEAAKVEPPTPVEIPVAEVRAARLRGEVVDVEWARQNFVSSEKSRTATGEGTSEEQEDVPLPTGFTRNYSFLTTRPEEIRVVDLPNLLEEYRMLVRTTETLLTERSQRASTERKERLLQAEKAIQESALKVELGFERPSSSSRRK
jgi:hypothetical protein